MSKIVCVHCACGFQTQLGLDYHLENSPFCQQFEIAELEIQQELRLAELRKPSGNNFSTVVLPSNGVDTQ